MRRLPSSQFDLGLERTTDTVKTERKKRMISKCGKFKLMSLSAAQPTCQRDEISKMSSTDDISAQYVNVFGSSQTYQNSQGNDKQRNLGA